jgi:ATP-binding cassette subfamily C protein/ATP-binding cassette subfamily C protein LapB
VHRIAELRGKSTVLICTHREDHMRLADRLMVIEKGELTMAGPPDKVLEAMHRRRA